LEAALMRSGLNVGLYGFGWQRAAGHCQYDFATGAALYKNARIALSDSFIDHQTPTRAFVSNRFIQALGAGAFLLQQHCADLEMYTGFRAGTHYVEWKGLRDLMDMLHLFLSRDDERRQIAQAGQRFVYERYTFDALVRQLFAEILPRLEARREPA
jgi:spore maturation protein CgeB